MPSFDRIRYRASVFLYAFDLIELNGDDLRRDPLEVRKATLATVLANAGIWFNDHIEGDGSTVCAHACKLGLEGIVSKRKDSPYRSGRSPDWLTVKREAEEDWGGDRPSCSDELCCAAAAIRWASLSARNMDRQKALSPRPPALTNKKKGPELAARSVQWRGFFLVPSV